VVFRYDLVKAMRRRCPCCPAARSARKRASDGRGQQVQLDCMIVLLQPPGGGGVGPICWCFSDHVSSLKEVLSSGHSCFVFAGHFSSLDMHCRMATAAGVITGHRRQLEQTLSNGYRCVHCSKLAKCCCSPGMPLNQGKARQEAIFCASPPPQWSRPDACAQCSASACCSSVGFASTRNHPRLSWDTVTESAAAAAAAAAAVTRATTADFSWLLLLLLLPAATAWRMTPTAGLRPGGADGPAAVQLVPAAAGGAAWHWAYEQALQLDPLAHTQWCWRTPSLRLSSAMRAAPSSTRWVPWQAAAA